MDIGEVCVTCGHERGNHSHGHCHWRQHGAVLHCHCTTFISPIVEAIKRLGRLDQDKVAAATLLGGISPDLISGVELYEDGGGHVEGVEITIRIHTGRSARKWLNDCLPKLEVAERVQEFLKTKGVL